MQRSVPFIVSGVHGRPALQEEVDGGDRWEVEGKGAVVEDHAGGVPGALL